MKEKDNNIMLHYCTIALYCYAPQMKPFLYKKMSEDGRSTTGKWKKYKV